MKTGVKARVTILSENSVVKPMGLIGEHGFAALVERGDSRILFDTGQGYALVHNARIMGVDLKNIDAVVLSHGHYDHTGGLAELLKGSGRMPVYAHPGIFASRFTEGPDGSRDPIGIPFTRAYLEGLGADFSLSESSQAVADGISTTGEVPRETGFEKGDAALYLCEDHGGGRDPHDDDLSLVVAGESGLLVLLGCAHAGLVNILYHVRRSYPDLPIKAVVGGTHLGFSGEEQMAGTVEAMAGLGIEKVGASHCTGLTGSARLREALGNSFFYAGAGSVLEV